MRKKKAFGCLKLSRVSGRQPDWQEFIFLRKCEHLLPKNAILTYMPSKLIENGETSRPLHTSSGFANGLWPGDMPALILIDVIYLSILLSI